MTGKSTAIAARPPQGLPSELVDVFAKNLRSIIDHEGLTESAWVRAHVSTKDEAEFDRLKKAVQRALNRSTSARLDTIETISKAAGLAPWQILFPKLDPSNPPVFAMTQEESDLYGRMKEGFARLPEVRDR